MNTIPIDCKDILEAYQHRWQQNNNSIVFFPLSEAYRKAGQIDQAIELCRFGLTKHPYYYGARVVLAKAYLDKKQFEEAKAELEKVVQMAPNNLTASKLLAQIYAQEGDLAKAVNRYKVISAFYPEGKELKESIKYLLEIELPRKKKILQILEQWQQKIKKNRFISEKTI